MSSSPLPPPPAAPKPGTVHLVGAGPGAVGMLTLRGAEVLASADVVLHDRLLLPEMLALIPPAARVIDVGKGSDGHGMKQLDIDALLIHHARQGHRVVRLKGGDPYIFGRGSEELLACRAAGLECEVVPGVSSAIAGPALADIPVTSRGVSRSLAIVTARSMAGPDQYTPDYAALARLDTIVILMGCKALRETAEALLRAGKSPDTPAALVERASWPDQRTLRAPLAGIAQAADELPAHSRLDAPVLLVVGPTAAEGFLGAQPLAGKRILATRPRTAQLDLVRRLRALGADVTELPLIRIEYLSPPPRITPPFITSDVLDVDHIVFTSLHGVRGFFKALTQSRLDSRALAGKFISAVGPKTASELWAQARLTADFVPDDARAEALVRELTPRLKPASRILFPCGSLAREELPAGLRQAGHHVHELDVYITHPVTPSEAFLSAARTQPFDAILLYSPSAVRGLTSLLHSLPPPPASLVLCIGPTTATAVTSVAPHLKPQLPPTYDDDGVIQTLRQNFHAT